MTQTRSDSTADESPRRAPDVRVVVRVCFGEHVIATYVADPALATRYAQAMERRFHGLQITTRQLLISTPHPELPPDLLWPLTVK
ncbi:hypothetical protein [Kribbella sp. CA-293567]|uniref:hypothetical protein n=1 Tax=Kribbella sp. CA-293567 TaxID=3002436 RepID=UPI0022DDFFCC|nr:hypothetical protein [Kribbella sp. CA-293567]WBQ03408.1 hypothetical protein OX958_25960 [Kribbella sp. CA-293567]